MRIVPGKLQELLGRRWSLLGSLNWYSVKLKQGLARTMALPALVMEFYSHIATPVCFCIEYGCSKWQRLLDSQSLKYLSGLDYLARATSNAYPSKGERWKGGGCQQEGALGWRCTEPGAQDDGMGVERTGIIAGVPGRVMGHFRMLVLEKRRHGSLFRV